MFYFPGVQTPAWSRNLSQRFSPVDQFLSLVTDMYN